MIKTLVETIGGIGLYGLISLLLFFMVFTGMLIWALRLKRPYLNHMSDLPLQGANTSSEPGDPNHA